MAETMTIPISEYGYAAFSASVPLDFGAVQDCEVYYLPHYSYAEVRLKAVKGVAPAHFGVLIAVRSHSHPGAGRTMRAVGTQYLRRSMIQMKHKKEDVFMGSPLSMEVYISGNYIENQEINNYGKGM